MYVSGPGWGELFRIHVSLDVGDTATVTCRKTALQICFDLLKCLNKLTSD